MWEDILKLELPKDKKGLYSSTTAMIHYAKGIAFASLRRVKEAEKERESFIKAVANVSEERFNSIPVKEVEALKIAAKMIHGEILSIVKVIRKKHSQSCEKALN